MIYLIQSGFAPQHLRPPLLPLVAELRWPRIFDDQSPAALWYSATLTNVVELIERLHANQQSPSLDAATRLQRVAIHRTQNCDQLE